MASSFDLFVDSLTPVEYEREFGDQYPADYAAVLTDPPDTDDAPVQTPADPNDDDDFDSDLGDDSDLDDDDPIPF